MPGAPWTWLWMALAVILSVGEILTGGLFLLPFGIGAAVASLLAITGADVLWQWVAFIGVAVIALVFARRIAHQVTKEPGIKTGSARHIGETGVVVEDLTSETGLVRIAREEWRADAPGFEPLVKGTKVVVTAIEGTHLVVRPADAPES